MSVIHMVSCGVCGRVNRITQINKTWFCEGCNATIAITTPNTITLTNATKHDRIII